MNNTANAKKSHQKEFINEVLKLKKEIFTLRLQKTTRQNVKPHLFKATRYQLAKLLTIKNKTNFD